MAKSYKQKRSRKPLSLDDCKLRLTDAIKQCERLIMDDPKDHVLIQATHAMAGAISRYVQLVETTEIIDRIEKLEEKANDT